jgi:uncharacterized protein (TIGR03790 family)
VPTNQVFGLELPVTETIGRSEFRDRLEKPLILGLDQPGLLRRSGGQSPPTQSGPGIRYLVLCHGVPVKIDPDPGLGEAVPGLLDERLRRNEAAVDSELAALPLRLGTNLLTGPLVNPVYGTTNSADLHPTRGVLMVARLDGPSAEVAQSLVEKAMVAENRGLWGRAYCDFRGLTNTAYLLGDQWIKGAAEVMRRAGFEVVTDELPTTFPPGFTLSQVALYAGWYDDSVSGPWALPTVEMRPGAFAYHLHSFSARVLRTPSSGWAGPLLARGATATVGYTEEPYLEATLDLPVFFSRWILLGFSYGEAVYTSQRALSWQTCVVGDPLYRPFRWPAQGGQLGGRLHQLHTQLLAARDPWIEWSHVHVVNINLLQGASVATMVTYLREQSELASSAVLQERLGDLLDQQGKLVPAAEAWTRALACQTTPQQRVRLLLHTARQRELLAQDKPALGLYQQFLAENPGHPERPAILRRALKLARNLGADDVAGPLRDELNRLEAGNTSAP